MNRRPETFQDWRRLYHAELNALGCEQYWQWSTSGTVRVNRYAYEMLDRIRRIRLRMEVEREAFTASYGKALLEMLGGES